VTAQARHRWSYEGLLLLAALIWGLAFVAQRVGMQHVGPLAFNGVRFLLGATALVPFAVWSSRRRADPPARRPPPGAAVGHVSAALPSTRPVIPPRVCPGGYWGGGLLAGLVLTGGATLQQYGIVYTSAGKAGFITGLYVVIVPVLGLIVRQYVPPRTWLGAALAVAGLYFLSVREDLSVGRGDLLCLAGAFFWALHLQIVGWLARSYDPVRIACGQFAVCALVSLTGAALLETTTWPDLRAAAWPILYAGLLSVAVAYTLQAIAQRWVPAAHAAIILSLETVFALAGGWLLLDESLPLRGIFGCVLMLTGMLVSQLARYNRSV
jgi:drug/metabolite transporter (DMT)-like permease